MARVLLIEDNEADARLIQDMLDEEDLETEWHASLDAGVRALRDGGFDAVLLDLSLPDSQGIESVSTTHLFDSQTPIIVLTGLDDDEAAMAAIAAGAHDYLIKGKTDQADLRRALDVARQRLDVQQTLGVAVSQERPPTALATAYVCPAGARFFPAVAQRLMTRGDAPLLYVSADRPGIVVLDRLAGLGMDTTGLHLIDASGSPPGEDGKVHVVERLDDLGSLALDVERACAALGPDTMIVVDSVNSLMLHHGLDATAVFCHALANRLRLLGLHCQFIGHDTPEWPFIADRLTFLDGIDHHDEGADASDPGFA